MDLTGHRLKSTPLCCSRVLCAYYHIAPPENSQECIDCPYKIKPKEVSK